MLTRLYWPCWVLAVATTGLVAGFMVSHALLLGRFLDWLLTSGSGMRFASTYPAFAGTAGRSGLTLFYGLCGIQIVAALAFLVVVEQAVLRSAGEIPGGLAARFVAWNAPIHVLYAAILVAGLGALLSVPLAGIKRS